MSMPNGTKICNQKSEMVYILGGFVNDVARELKLEGYGAIDYINKNTQCDYNVLEP